MEARFVRHADEAKRSSVQQRDKILLHGTGRVCLDYTFHTQTLSRLYEKRTTSLLCLVRLRSANKQPQQKEVAR